MLVLLLALVYHRFATTETVHNIRGESRFFTSLRSWGKPLHFSGWHKYDFTPFYTD
jgi:hypothetical protein